MVCCYVNNGLLKYEYYYLKTGAQTVSERVNVAVQCSLLPGPPLTLLKDPDGVNGYDSTTEEEAEEEMESSTSESSYI